MEMRIKRKTLQRILYAVLALLFLGVALHEYTQVGLTSQTYFSGGLGVLLGFLAATGAG